MLATANETYTVVIPGHYDLPEIALWLFENADKHSDKLSNDLSKLYRDIEPRTVSRRKPLYGHGWEIYFQPDIDSKGYWVVELDDKNLVTLMRLTWM